MSADTGLICSNVYSDHIIFSILAVCFESRTLKWAAYLLRDSLPKPTEEPDHHQGRPQQGDPLLVAPTRVTLYRISHQVNFFVFVSLDFVVQVFSINQPFSVLLSFCQIQIIWTQIKITFNLSTFHKLSEKLSYVLISLWATPHFVKCRQIILSIFSKINYEILGKIWNQISF